MPATVLLTNTNWWACSSHLAIALKDAGLRVAAVYPRYGHPLSKTDAVSDRFLYSATNPLVSLAQAIKRSGAAWILPCDDRAVRHLHQMHEAATAGEPAFAPLLDIIVRSIGHPDAYAIVASRSALLHAAEEAGVPVPATAAVLSSEDLSQKLCRWEFPLVIKVDGSWGGLGVKVVRSAEEAILFYARMVRPLGVLAMLKRVLVNRDAFSFETWRQHRTPGVTIQSFIKGFPANCVAFCKEGKVVALTAVTVVAAQSATGPATKIRLVEGQALRKAAEALASKLKLSGMHGFDFMVNSEDGSVYLIELNPRCAMPCHIRTQGDGDLVGSLAAELLGQDQGSRQKTAKVGDEIAYFPQAWLSNPKDESLRTGYHDVPWEEPRLVQELLLLPWPDRGLLARISDHLRGLSFSDRSARRIEYSASLMPETSSITVESQSGLREMA